MAKTPDRTPGVADEEGIILSDEGVFATVQGEIRYHNGRFSMFDSGVGEYDPASGSGLSASQHKALKDLIHFIKCGPADGWTSGAVEVRNGTPWLEDVTWYTDATKTNKIVDFTITRNTNKTVATKVWRLYDTDGSTVLVTLTDTFSHSGVFTTGRTRTWA